MIQQPNNQQLLDAILFLQVKMEEMEKRMEKKNEQSRKKLKKELLQEIDNLAVMVANFATDTKNRFFGVESDLKAKKQMYQA